MAKRRSVSFLALKRATGLLVVCLLLGVTPLLAKMTFTITGGYFSDADGNKIVEESTLPESVLFQLVNLGSDGSFDPVEAGAFATGDDRLIDLPISGGFNGSAFTIGGLSQSISGYFSRQFSLGVTLGLAEPGDAVGLRWWPGYTVQDYLDGVTPSAADVYGEVTLSQKYTNLSDAAYTAWFLPADTTTTSFDPAVTPAFATDFSSLSFVVTPGFSGLPDKTVLAVEPLRLVTPDDTRYADQHALASLNAPEAWFRSTGSSDVVIAVIDTGIDLDHPDLVGNLFTNNGESAFSNGIDDDGNGYIDDRNGWDFVEADNEPQDQNGHGTWMSGIIGASGNNALGIAGVGWNVKMLPLRCGVTTISETHVINAIDYVIALKQAGVAIAAINLAYSDPSTDAPTVDTPLKQAIDRAEAAGILLVAAAGNNGQDNDLNGSGQDYIYPADFPNVVSVASIDLTGQLAANSNFGAQRVALAAPGVSVLSTENGGGYGRGSGTSQAAAFVSGAAALVKSLSPDITLPRLKRVLTGSVIVTPELTGKVASNGKLDLERVIHAALHDQWMAGHFGANWLDDPDAKLTLNPDGDSGSTLEEFFHGTDPTAISDHLLSERRKMVKENGKTNFFFAKSPDAAIFNSTIEMTTDLTNPAQWAVVPEEDIQFLRYDAGTGLYEYKIEVAPGTDAFFRIVIETPTGLEF